ncbi:MAG: hypothetical protein DMF63_16610 [Acidobacteria bacterium]|nr:MAG: hypothetical protein DMF63_16610 [Acidobacteriota bacterium]
MSFKIFLLSLIVGLAFLLVCSCAPSSPQQSSTGSDSTDIPQLTDVLIRERINNSWVAEVPAENGTSQSITWSFAENEPKEIAIVDKKIEGTHATIVLDIKTASAPRARNQRYLAGQIRTEWQLRTGWVLRQWEIVDTENISMKYRDLPKPSNQNTNTPDPPPPPR